MPHALATLLLLGALVGMSPALVAQESDEVDSTERSMDVLDDLLSDFDVDVDSAKAPQAQTRVNRRSGSVRKPRLLGQYGWASFGRTGLAGETHGMTMFGGSVGMEQFRRMQLDDHIVKFKNDGIYVLYGQAGAMTTQDSSYDGVPLAMHSSIDALTVGFVDESGYGYMLGEESSLRFIVSDQSSWTSVRPQTYAASLDPAGWQSLRDFVGTLRFGSTMAPTLELRLGSTFGVRAGYSWTQVMPRHMFWYWAGSEVIEGVADGIVGLVVRSFGKSSPASLPVMNFILRNALAYGFKELRRDQMNWPFETAAPLNITSWNVGMSVTF